MKVLYVSRSVNNTPHPFIKEQADILSHKYGITIQHFFIKKGGLQGYAKAIEQLINLVKKEKPALVHAHYGLSALLAAVVKLFFFNRFKLVVTYHGSDINKTNERKLSLMAARFADHNILVSEKMEKYFKKHYSVIPCGINTDILIHPQKEIRTALGWNESDFVILFSSSFDRKEKDPAFAQEIVKEFSKNQSRQVRFIELKGFSREEMTQLMQAANVLIMCSISEGSPQIIKEAILNTLPVISNDVGDVGLICSGIDNCFIVPKIHEEYKKYLDFIAMNNVRVKNRESVIKRFDNRMIVAKIYNVYCKVLNINICNKETSLIGHHLQQEIISQ